MGPPVRGGGDAGPAVPRTALPPPTRCLAQAPWSRWRLPFRLSLLAGVSRFVSGLSHTRRYYRHHVSELLLPHLQLSSQPGPCPRLFQMSLNKVTRYTWRNRRSQGCLGGVTSQPGPKAARKKGSVQWVMSHQRTKSSWQITPKQNKLAVNTPLFFPSPNTK